MLSPEVVLSVVRGRSWCVVLDRLQRRRDARERALLARAEGREGSGDEENDDGNSIFSRKSRRRVRKGVAGAAPDGEGVTVMSAKERREQMKR